MSTKTLPALEEVQVKVDPMPLGIQSPKWQGGTGDSVHITIPPAAVKLLKLKDKIGKEFIAYSFLSCELPNKEQGLILVPFGPEATIEKLRGVLKFIDTSDLTDDDLRELIQAAEE